MISISEIVVLGQFLLVVIFNLIPLAIWAVWSIDQRRRNWLSRHRAANAARQPYSKT